MVLLAELAIAAGVLLSALFVTKEGVQWAARRWSRRALESARWSTGVHSDNGKLKVQIEQPGEQPTLVAAIDPADPDFDVLLEEAEVRANNMVKALNRAEARQK